MMLKKFHISLIILLLGFFAKPIPTYACGTKSIKIEESCCKKENKQECCKNYKSRNNTDKNGCDGKCNNPNCNCPTTISALALPFWAEVKAKIYFAKGKKTKSRYNKNYLSDGFSSIWTPPNIG